MLHSFLLNPTLAVESIHPTLFRTMRKLYEISLQRSKEFPSFEIALEELKPNFTQESEKNSQEMADVELQAFLRAQIIFEEFLKELVAITQAKLNIHNSMLKLQHNFDVCTQASNQLEPDAK